MAQYVYQIFFVLIETYFFNMIALRIMDTFDMKNKRVWMGIVCTIISGFLLYYYSLDSIISIIKTGHASLYHKYLAFFIIYGIAVIAIYLIFMVNVIGIFKFKSKRAKSFERSYAGKTKNYQLNFSLAGVAVGIGIFGSIYYTMKYTSSYKLELIMSYVILILGLLYLGYTIYSLIKSKKVKEKNNTSNVSTVKASMLRDRDIVFIIEENNLHLVFKATVKGAVNFHDLVGEIADYYYISNYGVLQTEDKTYDLYGFKTSSFDHEMLSQIKMNSFSNEDIERIIPYLEKNNKKVFKLDENKNPINSFDA